MKKTLITLAILIATIVSLFAIKQVFAKNNNDTERQQFMSNRSKAGEYKYEETTKKKQASLLADSRGGTSKTSKRKTTLND